MSEFELAIPVILKHECPSPIAPVGGGWVNDPRDRGGATVYGISTLIMRREGITAQEMGVPDLSPETLKLVTVETAKRVYKRLFWDRYGYENIDDQRCATKVFDAAVNCGPGNGHRQAQRACMLAGKPVVVDGLLGPRTVATINSLDPQVYLKCMAQAMADYYRGLVANNPSQQCWLSNWLRRAAWVG